MKRTILVLSGVCAAAAGYLVLGKRRQEPVVEELAHRLQEAWADQHTVV